MWALLFQIQPTDPVALTLPILALATETALAALPPTIRAVRMIPARRSGTTDESR